MDSSSKRGGVWRNLLKVCNIGQRNFSAVCGALYSESRRRRHLTGSWIVRSCEHRVVKWLASNLQFCRWVKTGTITFRKAPEKIALHHRLWHRCKGSLMLFNRCSNERVFAVLAICLSDYLTQFIWTFVELRKRSLIGNPWVNVNELMQKCLVLLSDLSKFPAILFKVETSRLMLVFLSWGFL